MNLFTTPVRRIMKDSRFDWSGFFRWLLPGGAVVVAFGAISVLDRWIRDVLFDDRSDLLSTLGAQSTHAVFFGCAVGGAWTYLMRSSSRAPLRLFVFAWPLFSIGFFILDVSLPLPFWSLVAVKLAGATIAFGTIWLVREPVRRFVGRVRSDEERASA